MHTAGKVLLILGGIITVIGIVITVLGAASAELDPSSENEFSGSSGTFTVPGDDAYGIYVKSSVNCETFTMTLEDSEGLDYFEKGCEHDNSDDLVDDDYIYVGNVEYWSTAPGDQLEVTAPTTIYIVGEFEAVGDAAGGFLAAAGGILIAICGGVILLIGIILALTLKSKEPVVMMQQGGQMMGGQMMQQPMQQMQQPVQQMQQPVQQMPQETTQQGYEFEQK
jgi:hypothetical protein